MKIIDIRETFNDYKKTALLIAVRDCDYKCCIEQGLDKNICQNHYLDHNDEIEISNIKLGDKILNNNLIEAFIFGGKEVMLDKYFYDMLNTIAYVRLFSDMSCVIYTGYDENEIIPKLNHLKKYKNIIVKFGRYKVNDIPIFNEILGVTLISSNQYAKQIS